MIAIILFTLISCQSIKDESKGYGEGSRSSKSVDMIVNSENSIKSVKSAKKAIDEASGLIKHPVAKEKARFASETLKEALPKMKKTKLTLIEMDKVIKELKKQIKELENAMYSGIKIMLNWIMGVSIFTIIGSLIAVYYMGRKAFHGVIWGLAGLIVSAGLLFIWDWIVIGGAVLCALLLGYVIYYAINHFKDQRDELVDNFFDIDVKKIKNNKLKGLIDKKHKE